MMIHAIIMKIYVENSSIVIKVELYKKDQLKCPMCMTKCKKHASHPHTTRWLCEEFFGLKCYIEYAPNRIKCSKHGCIIEALPWADYRSRFSKFVTNKIVVLSLYASKSFAQTVFKIKNWNTVNNIVNNSLKNRNIIAPSDVFEHIGIDETAYKKGHKYITIVYDHSTKNVIWSGEGKKKETLDKFFASLTKYQRNAIALVTADGAPWIKKSVLEWCPNAVIIMDPFHIMQWIIDIVNNTRNKILKEKKQQRRELVTKLRKASKRETLELRNRIAVFDYEIDILKRSRTILLRNMENLDDKELQLLNCVLQLDCKELIEAWEIKSMMHDFFNISDYEDAKLLFNKILELSRHSKNAETKQLCKKLYSRYKDILAYKQYHICNARIESFNTKLKVSIRKQFGIRNLQNLAILIGAIGSMNIMKQLYHDHQQFAEFTARKV